MSFKINNKTNNNRIGLKKAVINIFPSALTLVILILAFWLYFIPFMREQFMGSKKQLVREQTNTAWSILNELYNQSRQKKTSEKEVQVRAQSIIKDLRYGDAGKDYFWIIDSNTNMVMHPYIPSLNGKDVSNYQDIKGKRLFSEMVLKAEKNGSGFVRYHWQWKDSANHVVPKLSYVKLFEPWGWIVGTGLYIDDVDENIAEIINTAKQVFIAVGVIVLLIIIIISIRSFIYEKMREKAENELFLEKENLRITFNSIGDGVIVTDTNERITRMNPIALELTGFSKQEAVGMPIKDVFRIYSSETGKKAENPVAKVLKEGKIVGLANHTKLISKQGEEYQIADSGAPIRNVQGLIIGVVLVFRDVTEDYEVRKALKESEDRLAKTLKAANDGSWDWDLKTNHVFFDKRYYEMAGYENNEFPHQLDEFQKRVHPDDLPKVMKMAEDHLAGNVERFHVEFRFQTRNSGFMWVLGRGVIVEKDESGAPKRFIGTHTDISQRKSAELELNHQKERLSHILEGTNAGTWEWNVQTGETVFNERWAEIIGYKLEEIQPVSIETWLAFLHPDDAPVSERKLNKHFAGEDDYYECEVRMKHKKGHWVWVLDRGKVISRTTDGKPLKMFGTHQDITRRKKNEEEIQQFFSVNLDLLCIADQKGIFLKVNKAWEQILGYKTSEIENRQFMDFVHPNDHEATIARMSELDRQEEVLNFVNRYQHKNGTYRYIEWRSKPAGDLIYAAARDVTDRIETEEELTRSREDLRTTLNSLADGVIATDKNGIITKMNPVAEKLTSWSVEDARGKDLNNVFNVVNTATGQKETNSVQLVLKKGVVTELSNHRMLIDKNGIQYPIADSAAPIKNTEGEITGVVLIFRDMTEEYRIKEELRNSEERFKLAVEGSRDGLWDWDLVSNKAYHSPQYARMLGYEPSELPYTSKAWSDLLHPEDIDKAMHDVKKYLEGTKPYYESTFRLRAKNGKYKWITGRGKALFNEKGKPIRFVGFNTDVTGQKENEKALLEAKEKAEESDRLKTAFLANMSHEIRTPMNGILGFTKLLGRQNISGEKRRGFIEIIEKSGKRMLRTINDLVSIAKIEADQVILFTEPININELVNDLYVLFKGEAKAKGLTFVVSEKVPEKDADITTDWDKVSSVLSNLIHNAIKYTDQGSVEVQYHLKNKKIHFCVKDTGIGIAKSRQKAIFDRFVQADIEDKEVREGTGLGLAISKSYIEMLNGEIWLDSAPGEGSEFHFTIPIKKQS